MGRGFDWEKKSDELELSPNDFGSFLSPSPKLERSISDHHSDSKRRNRLSHNSGKTSRPISIGTPPLPLPQAIKSIITGSFSTEPAALSPNQSRPPSPLPLTPGSGGLHSASSTLQNSSSGSRTPATPRPSRRSSQQRVSLIAGRVLIAPMDDPQEPPPMPHRNSSSISSIGSVDSDRPPLPHDHSFIGERKISEFVIDREIGRGAYGLVKLAREIQEDESLGVSA